MSIKIDVKRTGFPVEFGTLKLWFDSSMENLRNFFEVEEIANKKLKEVQEKAKHIHFPDDKDVELIHGLDPRSVDAALDLNKEHIALQYDIIFGEGSFKKIYKEYPDIVALEMALDPLGKAIAEKIIQQEEEREKEINKKKKEYLDKKAKK